MSRSNLESTTDRLDTEIPRLRAETPACTEVVHFNHAGDSPSPRRVLDAVIGHLELEARIGGYEAADAADDLVEGAYTSIAALINTDREEIALVENATRGWDMAFYSIPFQAGDRILTSASEYGSNAISFLQVAEATGATIDVIPSDDAGQVSVSALADLLDDRVKVVAISHMPTNGGLVQPAAEIGHVLRQRGDRRPIYLLDACQTVGQMPIDVRVIGCDVLSATSRKYLRGPRGVGFLYVRRNLIEQLVPAFLDNHAADWVARDRYRIRSDARRFENWENYVAGRIGLGTAVDYAMELGLEPIWERIRRQADRLRVRLTDLPGVTVRDLGEVKGGIVTFDVDGVDAKTISTVLLERRINTSISTILSTRYDMERRGINELVRASVHYLTTESEIETLCAALEEVIQAARA